MKTMFSFFHTTMCLDTIVRHLPAGCLASCMATQTVYNMHWNTIWITYSVPMI